MHEEHLCIVALTSNGARNPVLSACLLPPCVIAYCSSSTSRWITGSCTWIMKILIIVVLCCARFNDCIGFVFIVWYVLICLPFCWCHCMAINVSVQYDGGFLPDIILLTQCYYHRGTRLNAMKRFCIFSYWSHLNVLTFFPPDWGMLRRSRCIQIFLLKHFFRITCPNET